MRKDFVAGAFVWTGFDYRGEPSPFSWPNVNSHFGVLDLAGFEKAGFYYYQSVFFKAAERPIAKIIPERWDFTAGKRVDVWVYTNGEEVELFINDRSLGKKSKQRSCAHDVKWTVPFEPGELRAVVRVAGRRFATNSIKTPGPAAAIHLQAAWGHDGFGSASLLADGTSTALLTARVVDANGILVSSAAHQLSFELSGPGRLVGLGNGDPNSHEPDKPASATQGARSAWHGLARAIVQTAGTATQRLRLRCTAPKLAAAEMSLEVLPAAPSNIAVALPLPLPTEAGMDLLTVAIAMVVVSAIALLAWLAYRSPEETA